MKMTTEITKTFENSRTPEALKAILLEYSNNFLLDSSEDISSLANGNPEDIVDGEFGETDTNNDVYQLLEYKAGAIMWIGIELYRCLLLWRGRHELGATAELVERNGRLKMGVMAVVDGKLTVLNGFDSITHPVEIADPKKQARRLLRSLKG